MTYLYYNMDVMIEKVSQQRRFPRVGVKIPVRYQTRGYPQIDNTVTQDISIQGLRLLGERYIAPETALSLEINLATRTIRATGKIAWSTVLPRSDRHYCGIEFLELEPQERVYLADFIRNYIRTH